MVNERTRQVVVVDDDDQTRRLVVGALEYAGYYVMPFSSGGALLAHLSAERSYDLLVLDVQMPGLSGFAVAREVRRQPHLDKMAILALTGLSDARDAVLILEAGADAYLSKPVDISELTALVAELLADFARPPS